MSNAPDTAGSTRKRRSWIAWTLGALAALVLAAGTVLAVVHFCAARRVEQALVAIRARSEPVLPVDIVAEPVAHPSRIDENATAFEAVSASLIDTFTESKIDAYLATPDAGTVNPDTIAALKELRSCIATETPADEDFPRYGWVEMDRALARGEEPSSCGRVAHRARRLLLEPTIPAASTLCLGDSVDARSLLQTIVGSDAFKNPTPTAYLSTIEVALAVNSIVRSSIDLALEGRAPEAVGRLKIAFEGPKRIASRLSLVGFSTWCVAERQALQGLRVILPRLPAGFALQEFGEHVEPQRPERDFIVALEGERTLGNWVYARFVSAAEGPMIYAKFRSMKDGRMMWRFIPELLTRTILLREQATYLDRMTEWIEDARGPYRDSPRSDSRLQGFTNLTLPHAAIAALNSPDNLSLDLEAQILLARAALVAYRDGAEAGARAAAASIDPFDGNPLRSRIDPDGTLLLWSVGENHVEDGGVAADGSENPPKNFVWWIPRR